ncbi:hypothetical protein MGN70_012731 [Eutypa lata]|uniref:Putative ethyl tert-butyl ether degradation ethd protein n=1 Tax=Eutypa lata (strain UCR-EL1) TaxID=1287681 RepID=M7TWV5_EUTLA|nr:putative ethyl tert-butyl ether degradation ethd protein [Eutypa lata UCREL1]KAI1245837.1 hypothetical protein MGN70_012731 [Eutypa lata]
MTVKYTILFTQGAVFDLDHYVKVHMPMLAKSFPSTLLSWEVSTLPADAPFCVQAHVEWANEEAFNSLPQSEAGRKVFADIPNFSKEQPIFMKCQPLASGP